jgi:hypothetical protein
MIVLEVRCGLSKGAGTRCGSHLGYVDSDMNILYTDKTPGFLNSCASKPSHHYGGLQDFGPYDPDEWKTNADQYFGSMFPGEKIPAHWIGTGPVKVELVRAAEEALQNHNANPRAKKWRLPVTYYWPNV